MLRAWMWWLVLAAVALVALVAGDRDLFCDDYKTCSNAGTLKGPQIECDGDSTCQHSTLESPRQKCRGAFACEDAGLIVRHRKRGDETYLYCHGHMSCRHATFSAYSNVQCYGYKSCNPKARLNAVDEWTASTASVVGELYCGGANACTNLIVDFLSNKYVHCMGRSSCAGIRLPAANVYCTADHGCAGATITLGQHAAESGRAYFLGRGSAVDATVRCSGASARCEVVLSSHALEAADGEQGHLRIECTHPATATAVVNGQVQACSRASPSDEPRELPRAAVLDAVEDAALDIVGNVDAIPPAICRTPSNECQNKALDQTRQICSGYQACMSSTWQAPKDKALLECRGFDSCLALRTIGDDQQGTVLCTGDSACLGATLKAARIWCLGFLACATGHGYVTATEATNVLDCGGAGGCFFMTQGTAPIVFCDGYVSCYHATIQTTKLVCGDDATTERYGCSGTIRHPTVSCSSTGCHGATISAAASVDEMHVTFNVLPKEVQPRAAPGAAVICGQGQTCKVDVARGELPAHVDVEEEVRAHLSKMATVMGLSPEETEPAVGGTVTCTHGSSTLVFNGQVLPCPATYDLDSGVLLEDLSAQVGHAAWAWDAVAGRSMPMAADTLSLPWALAVAGLLLLVALAVFWRRRAGGKDAARLADERVPLLTSRAPYQAL